ncbi:hypothetical protein ACOMHN_053469 [Nucella lapillus]
MAAIMRGNRGGNVLVYRHFQYHKHRSSGNFINWRCWRRNCRAKLRTNQFDEEEDHPNIRIVSYEEHVHPADTSLVNRSRFQEHLVHQSLEDPTRPCHRTYNAEVVRLRRQGGGDRPDIPTFQGVRSSMQRARAAIMPAISRTIEDVQVEGPWAETWNQDRFLLHSDNDWGILIFATDENLSLVQRCRNLYMDGTLKSCPRPYMQVFTIFGRFNGFVVPFVHVLMERKTVGHYRQVFQALKAAVRRVTHHRLRPALVVYDFEEALHTAVETEFPGVNVGGCYFHFNQSLWRRLQHLGLAGPYHENDRLAGVVQKIMALGYLPVALVQLNFNALVNRRRTRRLVAIHPDLDDFLNYVRNTYIRAGCPFPPVVWNVFDRPMDQRTNSHVESFHRAFNDAVQIRHPPLWSFLRHLKDHQTVTEETVTRARRGEAPPRCRRKWRLLEERLVALKRQYNHGDRDLNEYWRAVSHLVLQAV